MAITKRFRKSGIKYQVKVKGADGSWITETFSTLAKAREKEAKLVNLKSNGTLTNTSRQVTVGEYFHSWHELTQGNNTSDGWRNAQRQMFHDYVEPVIGAVKVQGVTPALVARVIQTTAGLGRAPQTVLHVFNLIHTMLEDAVEVFEILDRNPAIKKLKPKIPEKEAAYLEVEAAKKLLKHVRGKAFEVAICIQILTGLRVGEVQALLWENVDLVRGVIHVRRTYVRREKRFKEYPKGRKWHAVKMPPELVDLLRKVKPRATSKFVATSPRLSWLSYHGLHKAVRRYCKEAGVRQLATHGLRHSASEIWMAHGASRDDMRILLGHSSEKVTSRYIHDKGERLGNVAKVIRLFPDQPGNSATVSPEFPQRKVSGVDEAESPC